MNLTLSLLQQILSLPQEDALVRSTGILIRRMGESCSCWDFCRRMSGEKNPNWLR